MLEKQMELSREKKAMLEKQMELTREKIVQVVMKLLEKKELELAQEIFTDQEYTKVVENSDLQEKIKKIIVELGPFTGSEIDVFVQENLNRPVLEEIFNDFKGNKDIRNAMKKYGVTTIHPIMSHLIFLEFFYVNETLIE